MLVVEIISIDDKDVTLNVERIREGLENEYHITPLFIMNLGVFRVRLTSKIIINKKLCTHASPHHPLLMNTKPSSWLL